MPEFFRAMDENAKNLTGASVEGWTVWDRRASMHKSRILFNVVVIFSTALCALDGDENGDAAS
jgi:hypothetical protein